METCIKVAGDGIRLDIPLFPLKNSKDFLVMQYPINEIDYNTMIEIWKCAKETTKAQVLAMPDMASIEEMDKDDIRQIVDKLVAILKNEASEARHGE